MKILFLILFIFSFLSVKLNAQQSTYCDDLLKNQLNAYCGGWTEFNSQFEFLGCFINFKYKARDCYYNDPNCPNPKRYRQVSVFYMDIDGANEQICQFMLQNLFPGYPDYTQINNVVFEQMFAEANESAAMLSFLNFYSAQPQWEKQKYQCEGTPPNCTMPTYQCELYEVFASNPTCQRICYGVREPLAPTTLPLIFFNYGPCDDETNSCCEKSIKFCMCDGQVKKEVVSTNPANNACDLALPSQIDCFPVSGYQMHLTPDCIILCP